MNDNAIPVTKGKIESLSLAEFQRQWELGYWLTAHEAAWACGVSRSRIHDAADRGWLNLPHIKIGRYKFFHISWLAEKYPDAEGCAAWLTGDETWFDWVNARLER